MKNIEFKTNSFAKRLKSMLLVDFKRLSKSRFFYIMLGISLVVPILIVVMTTLMDGSVTVDQNGNETVMKGFESAWQSIGSLSTADAMGMDLTSMCNINLMYFAVAVFICLFIAEDFRSGYSKNLFAVRSKKTDYVISKTLIGFVSGTLMLIAYFVGSMLGAAMAGLSFALEGVTAMNIVACMLAKVFLMAVFSAIFVLIAIITKSKSWLSICLSLSGGMLLFMMIPAMTPLDSNFMNVILCLAGGVLFSAGLGAISNLILRKTSLV